MSHIAHYGVGASYVIIETQVARNTLSKTFDSLYSFCIDDTERKEYAIFREGVANVFEDLEKCVPSAMRL